MTEVPHFPMLIRQHRANSTRNNYSMPIVSSETLAQGSGSLLLKPGDTVSFFFVGILDDPFGSKPRFLRGDWLIHEIRRENLSIIGITSTPL